MKVPGAAPVLIALAVIGGCLGGAAWAAWPQLSRLAGIGPVSPLDRKVTIHFAAQPTAGNPYNFRPLADRMTLRLGETGIAFYQAENSGSRALVGQAQYHVTPAAVDKYVVRVACFCTQQQSLAPHEKIEMPVTFFVDPSIASDPKFADLRDITLSYTFHEAKGPERQAAVTKPPVAILN
ncbi:MAG: cytochrome c oxidase assembly protein [Paracoccaceae bacterium]|nr:cytochrome c oxidase assembly protein [Paracoccaceae bacterium]MDE3120295.1 cytochrome c oxidase assembly protein [Paracoccaceae bacterium]